MEYDHSHASLDIRLPLLWALLKVLHLPTRWLVASRSDLPHDPECTPATAVLRS